MNALGFPLYLHTILRAPNEKVSYYLALVALILWWKCLYYLKGFRATGPLVQMVTQTVVEVRWFILLLLIIGFGFGSGFYILFRHKSAAWADVTLKEQATKSAGDSTKNLYGWSSPVTVYLSMLAILLGEFNSSDFIDPDNNADTIIAISFLVAYVVLVVIVMLNLLISIVSRVYERCQVNYEEEFLRAKAQLICEIEQVGRKGLTELRRPKRREGCEFESATMPLIPYMFFTTMHDSQPTHLPFLPLSPFAPLLPCSSSGLLPRQRGPCLVPASDLLHFQITPRRPYDQWRKGDRKG